MICITVGRLPADYEDRLENMILSLPQGRAEMLKKRKNNTEYAVSVFSSAAVYGFAEKYTGKPTDAIITDYDKNGKPTYRLSNKNSSDNKKVEILPPPDNVHTTVLQTVIAEMIVQFSKMNFCNARMHVFDGKKSFDIIFNDEGKETLLKSENSPYEGNAVKCSFYADDLGQKHDDLIFQITHQNPVSVWIMRDKKTNLPFIAKLEKPSTLLGKLTVYTKNIEIKD